MHLLARISLGFISEHSHLGFTFALGLAAFIVGTLLRRLHAQQSGEGNRKARAQGRLHLRPPIAPLRSGEESTGR